MDWVIDSAKRTKYTALFQNLCADAGGVTALAKHQAGLDKAGLNVETLMSIWRLADLDGDDYLTLPEYLICGFLIARCHMTGEPLPTALPLALIDSAKGEGEGEWTLDAAQVTKYSTLFQTLSADAGGATALAKHQAGLDKAGLSVETLMHIWRLADVDGDDLLSQSEFLICCVLIARCHTAGEAPPETLPPALAWAATERSSRRSR